jgi:DNA-binding response OmpR family regulator
MESMSKSYKLGIYTFEPGNMTLEGPSDKRSLTRKETALLTILCQNENKLVSREFLLKEVWGDDDYFLGRSMDVFIAKLRKYLSEETSIAITNVHGAGFKLENNKQQ